MGHSALTSTSMASDEAIAVMRIVERLVRHSIAAL